MRTILTCAAALSIVMTGCNHAGTASDAGVTSDAGTSSDAVVANDCGCPPDAPVDAGDAAVVIDAGPTDAGGSFCDLSHPCVGRSQFCDTPTGTCGAAGQCASYDPAVLCPAIAMPVCGCNGMTYSNACYARRAGQALASTAACPTSGCRSNADCNATQFCQFADGVCGGVGTCQSAGITLFCMNTCNPECGCNGVSYVNACLRHKQRTSLMSAGACPGTRPPC